MFSCCFCTVVHIYGPRGYPKEFNTLHSDGKESEDRPAHTVAFHHCVLT